MLGKAALIALIATADPERAKDFYARVLGLRLVSDEPYAIVFDSSGMEVRIQKVERLQPQPFTALGWRVGDIRGIIAGLSQCGVTFERYSFMEQDAIGVWQAPSGAKVAWFKDPDGNLLSLTEAA